MIDEIAQTGCQSILAGVVRLSSFSINQMEKATGRDLRSFYKDEVRKSSRDFHYSDLEIRAYYERIHAKCIQNNIEFTTCYIGNGESQFWSDQDLWSNKADCCNVKGKIKSFETDSRNISWDLRLKYTSHKSLLANSFENLHRPLNTIKPLEIIYGKAKLKEGLLLN